MRIKKLIFSILFTLISFFSFGQKDSSYIDFSAYIWLDSVTITAQREGFDIQEFIKIIQNDNTLETSFNNLRKISYVYTNDIRFMKDDRHIESSYFSENKQMYNGICQWMEVSKETVIGDYYNRKGEHNYYTSDLYDRVFYQSKEPCNNRPANTKVNRAKRVLENRINELKKLIYTPGKEANIPLIGEKTAIFSKKMIEHYDFSIRSITTSQGQNIYVFTATINPVFNASHPDGSVVKYLEIMMAKGNFQVLSRKYKLQYDASIYKFDIVMLIELEKYKDMYIPADIKYDGYWKILGKRKENCTFHFQILDFIE